VTEREWKKKRRILQVRLKHARDAARPQQPGAAKEAAYRALRDAEDTLGEHLRTRWAA
jgi:hypothetical protein